MKPNRLIKFALAVTTTIACYVIIAGVKYDSDDVLATSSANDTIGAFGLIGITTGIYGLVQLYKLIKGT